MRRKKHLLSCACVGIMVLGSTLSIQAEENVLEAAVWDESVTTGFQIMDGDTYYYDDEGNMVYGEKKIGENWYYFDLETGIMQTGFVKLGRKTVYYGADGAMVFGEHIIDGVEYCFSFGNGGLYTGFVNHGNDTVYYSSGVHVYGEKKIDGNWYYFDLETGIMQTGFVKLGSKTVYYDEKGIMTFGEKKINGKWYYFKPGNGAMQIGFTRVGPKTVYYDLDGTMVSGEQTIDGVTYYFDSGNGGLYTGFFKQKNGILYYLNGIKIYGEKKINGDWYCFDSETGIMKIGFAKLGAKTVYYGSSGAMCFGEKKINGKWYYFKPGNGAMQIGFVNLGYKTVYYGSDGVMCFGTHIIDGKKYYFAEGTGKLIKQGWYYENGYKLYYRDGNLVKDVRNIIGSQSNYHIMINKQLSCITVYAKDGGKGYIIPVVSFACSPGEATPLGTFYTSDKYRWHQLYGAMGQWCTRITGHILFHSPPYTSYNNKTLWPKEYNKLGSWASQGCVRLRSGDAKWIYDNCTSGTKVTIYNSSDPGPLGKPTYAKISLSQTWDPTDPTIK